MCRMAQILQGRENRRSSKSISASAIEVEILGSFTLPETLILASLTTFPATFDLPAGAAVAGVTTDELKTALTTFLVKEVIHQTSSTPPLLRLVGDVRDVVIGLPVAQDEIRVARSRHDKYFLGQLTGDHEPILLAQVNEPHREFSKANLELAAMRHIRRLVGLPEGRTGLPGDLTKRQWDVAQLVAAGRTNFQIAQTLGISEWTVVNHLRLVMRRLGCASRVDVARAVLS